MLLDELAEWLAARRPDLLAWSPAEPYDPADVRAALIVGPIPPTLDRAVGLAVAPMELGQIRGALEVPLQVRSRGRPDDLADSDQLCDAVAGELRDAHNTTLPGGTWLAVVRLNAGRPGWLGRDATRRHQHVINARLFIGRPT
ncbi:minor capsid protein [Frankia sp. Mgl5]|uniref:minor capsid protein n=1 Tax=Frankia sp. Mgl5 TaxID=2933793 RepID=UPI00200D2D8A|nr:minor capsid protein [Frankia sp. Mgl5]MCK9928804.1 minor capsid protein [Frankia sp. Mgl5]